MKKEILATCALLSMLFISAVNAQISIPNVAVRTDKPTYQPGEKGTIYITFYNSADDPVVIENITVVYEDWQAYIDNKWVGNDTIEYKDEVVTKNEVGQYSVDFVVPSDGRAETSDAEIYFSREATGWPDAETTIYVTETPYFMEQIITLLTILVVLLIVCTIIIAATIFLSRRRPPVTWRQERPQETG